MWSHLRGEDDGEAAKSLSAPVRIRRHWNGVRAVDLGEVSHEHFAELIGEVFRVDLGDSGELELELTEAEKVKGDRPDNAFSVLFRGPRERFLEQRVYEVEHGSLGRLPIFLVPISEKQDGFVYEAVFTRMEREGD
jgi:hypothetical protein